VSWLDDHLGSQHRLALLVAVAAVLALGASVGLAWVAGFENVSHRLAHFNWAWLPVALAGELVAYIGYILAYREITRAERGCRVRAAERRDARGRRVRSL